MPLSRQEIGNYLGLSAETVSRILVKMQNEQLITFDKRHICLRNLAALQNQSQMLAHENI
jgi:CRP-like cAMP-binding protein